MLVLIIPIYGDPAHQLKNLSPIVPFKKTKRKGWLINASFTPGTKALIMATIWRRRRDLSGVTILPQLLKSLFVSAEDDAIVRKPTAI
jgi:hypothetical protein